MLVKCGVVPRLVQIGDPTAGGANGESRDAASSPVNGPALLPTHGKAAVKVQRGAGVAELTVLIR